MSNKIISILLVFIIVISLGCENKKNDVSTDANINNDVENKIRDIENVTSDNMNMSVEIVQTVEFTINQYDDITKSRISYESMKENVESLFTDTAAFSGFIEFVGTLVIWKEENNDLIFASDLNDENIDEYRSIIRDAINEGKRWYFTDYQISNVIFEGDQEKVLVKVSNQVGHDFYFMYIFSIDNNTPYITHFTMVDYIRHKSYFREFNFEEEVKNFENN